MHKGTQVIQTERLTLHRFTVEDAPWLCGFDPAIAENVVRII